MRFVGGRYKFRQVLVELQQSPCSQVLLENLAHQVDLEERWKHLIVKLPRESEAFLLSFTHDLTDSALQGNILFTNALSSFQDVLRLAKHFAREHQWRNEQEKRPHAADGEGGGEGESQDAKE